MAESEKGKWEDPFELWNVAVHASLLPTGKVLYWGRRCHPKGKPPPSMNQHFCNTYIWDPVTKTNKVTATQPTDKDGRDVNLFCSGHCFQPDGTLFVAGGHWIDGVGLRQACVYNPWNDTWTAQLPMIGGRWYPSCITLPDGRVFVISGASETQWQVENRSQIWHKDHWVSVAPKGGPLSLYPRLHLSPNGRIFTDGPQIQSQFLDVSAAGVDEFGKKLDGSVGAWSAGTNRAGAHREYAPSVMYDKGKIMFIGGGLDNKPFTGGPQDWDSGTLVEFIDLNKSSDPTKLEWKSSTAPNTSNMKFARQQHNATVLPDGKILVTGGTSGKGFNNLAFPVRIPELFDPTTSTDPTACKWTEMAEEKEIRCYHSISLLLPDGSVLSAGGGEYDSALDDSNNITTARLFKPPYFYKGIRPTIVTAPTDVEYNKEFPVTVATGNKIAKASWVRLGSVTHSNNFNQSLMFLATNQQGSTVKVTPPAGVNEAPPGHYMLFLLDNAGLPSEARIIKIGPVPPLPQEPATVPPKQTTTSRRVALSHAEIDEKIITKQDRPAVSVGITPLCYYGLGPCWGGAYDGLNQISDIDIVRPVPSQLDSVAFVYLKEDVLPDIDKWRSEFDSTANGSYVMRGIEMTLSGVVTKKHVDAEDQLTLSGTSTRPELVLKPFKPSSQILWDKDAKVQKPITDAEAGAYEELSKALAEHAEGLKVEVTGWLEKLGAGKFSLHVRKFEK